MTAFTTLHCTNLLVFMQHITVYIRAPARFLKRVDKKYFVPPTFEFGHPKLSVLGGTTRIVAHPNY